MKNWSKKKKIIFVVLTVLLLIVTMVSLYFILTYYNKPKVYIRYKTNYEKEIVIVDVCISKITEDFQAASFMINFDTDKLSFEELKQGNSKVKTQVKNKQKLPSWEYNKEVINKTGQVKTLYLDMSAGNAPFIHRKHAGILYQLVFHVNNPDLGRQTTKLTIEQATFASVNPDKSLALQKENIRIKNAKIKIDFPI